MKKLFILVAMLALGVSSLTAQDTTETLFGKDLRFGGFGGPVFEFGPIAEDFVPLAGGGGGVIINDFFIGGYGMGTSYIDPEHAPRDEHVAFGHGGFWLGYAYQPYKLAHVFVDAKIGWGGYTPEPEQHDNFNFEDDVDNVFVFQPGAGIELNLLRWFKIALVGHYRYVDGVSPIFYGLTNDDFREYSASLTLRFGGFGNN